MNIVNKLTLRQLIQNKRRTLVTIIGVIISVAMVTAVATIGVSFMDLLQRQTIAESGEWHVQYMQTSKEQIAAIKNDENTKTLVLKRDVGYALLEGGQNESKPYVFIREYSEEGFTQFPINLREGRLPKTPNEVVISADIARNAKVEYKIGDTISLQVGNRILTSGEDSGRTLEYYEQLRVENGEVVEGLVNTSDKTYTVVGIIERPKWELTWSPSYSMISYIDETFLENEERVDTYVVVNKINSKMYEQAESLANTIGVQKVSFNNGLLRYYGVTNNDNLQRTMYSLVAVIMGVIVIGSVSLIYNAFAISVSERSRYLGMLSSVGATKRQKRNSVFFEGAVIGLISIPLGILSGLLGIGVTFLFINSAIVGTIGLTEEFQVVVTPMSIMVAVIVSMVTIFISTYIPARRASRISAIDAIRQTMDIKLTGKKVKTSKLIRLIFGIEAEIGLKNLKRNKRRYQATVFSLMISIVLFLAVSHFTGNLKKSLELSQNRINYDIEVSLTGSQQSKIDKLLKYASLEDVTESNIIQRADLEALIPVEQISEPLREFAQTNTGLLQDGKYPYSLSVISIDENYLKAYAAAVGADYDQLNDAEHWRAIIVDTFSYQDVQAGKYVEMKALYGNIGQVLNLRQFDWKTDTHSEIGQIEIAVLTDQLPMGVLPANLGGLNMIVSPTVFSSMKNSGLDQDIWTFLYLKSTDPLKTQEEIEETKDSMMFVHNVYKSRQQEGQLILLISVFTYGFISLITAISIANIFNTISTSISLRKREFGMLKSVGMTPKGFNKMINYESIFYGIKALLYGLPISFLVMYLIHRSLMNSFEYHFMVPWMSVFFVIAAVFVIVGISMLYSSAKVKKENIIDALKQENI